MRGTKYEWCLMEQTGDVSKEELYEGFVFADGIERVSTLEKKVHKNSVKQKVPLEPTAFDKKQRCCTPLE